MRNSDITGQQGVNFLERFALERGWYFRPITIFDVGVDAEIEVAHEGRPTGRLIAIQSKAGPSYFSEPTDGGWYHRVSQRHAAYWLDHSLPVIVVLVDLEEAAAYWQLITDSTLEKAGENFKVLIPRHQVVASAEEDWRDIALDVMAEATRNFEPNLAVLPPIVAARLRAELTENTAAPLLAFELARARFDVSDFMTDLLRTPPRWMPGSAANLWGIASLFAFEHGQYKLAAEALALSAAALDAPGEAYVQAANMALGVDRDLARELADLAEDHDGSPLGIELLRFRLEHGQLAVREQAGGRGIDLSRPEAEVDIQAQAFMSHVAFACGDLDDAVRHSSKVLDLSGDSSSAMLHLARALLARSRTVAAQAGDASRAAALATEAVDQRRRWDGSTETYLEFALHALTVIGDYAAALQRATPSPHGIATSAEASRTEVARHALVNSALLGERISRAEIVNRVADPQARDLLRIEFPYPGDEVQPQDRIDLWTARLDAALTERDLAGIDHAVRILALEGVDRSQALQPFVDDRLLPEHLPQLIRAVKQSLSDLEEAIPTLRTMAQDDIHAAHYLVAALARHRRYGEAADVLGQATTRFSTPEFLAEQVKYLHWADRQEEARSVGEAALQRHDFIGRDRAEVARYLQMRAFQRRDWTAAQRLGQDGLVSLGFTDSELAWNVVRAMLNQELRADAAGFIRRHALRPADADEVAMWLVAFPAEQWDRTALAEAVDLAIRFEDDVNLSAAILGAIASFGDGDSTVAELHVRAMQLLETHISRYGDESPIKAISGNQIEQLVALVRQQGEAAAEPFRAAMAMAKRGQIPIGAVAVSIRRPYSFVYMQQLLGYLPAGAYPDEVHEAEVGAALDALGHRVVVDPSALLLGALVPAVREVRGHFSELLIHPDAVADLHDGIAENQRLARSAGSMSWSARDQSAAFTEYTETDRARLLSDAALIRGVIQAATVSEPPSSAAAPLGVLPKGSGSWMGGIDLAIAGDMALWSDDAAHRGLASAFGVRSFGTPAVLEAVARRRIEADSASADRAAERLQQHLSELIRAGVADVTLHPADLLRVAEEEGWSGVVASVPLARPSWWISTPDPLPELRELLTKVREHNPDQIDLWRARAMAGAALVQIGEAIDGRTMVAAVALVPTGPEADVAEAVHALEIGQIVAETMDIPNPEDGLVVAAALLATENLLGDPANYTRAILDRLSEKANGGGLEHSDVS